MQSGNQTSNLQYDVAIVGGGVVGAAAAWKLAKAGAKVALLEKGDLCSGASSTNPGFCVLSYRENSLTMRFALEQQRSWDALQSEIGDVEYVPSGGLIPLTDHAQEEILSGLCRHAKKLGLDEIGLITAAKAKELEPALDESQIVGGCWCPGEGRVNPFKMNLNMAAKAKELGADIFTHTPVTNLLIENGLVRALETPRGEIKADLFILANGAWARELTRIAGHDIPILFERGEAMVSMQVAPRVKRMITDGALFNQSPVDHPMVIGACLGQTVSGNIVIAQATTRPDDYDKSNSFDGPRLIAKRVLKLFPSLKDIEIIRMWAGLVSYTDDHQPVFGAFVNPNNLFVANTFHSAVAISPAIGGMIADYWKTGSLPEEAKPYTPERFA
jgi:sarcosine oxidase subunit beta